MKDNDWFPEECRRPKKPNMQRRAPWHKYDKPGTYLITLTVDGRLPVLGTLQAGETPRVIFSELGMRICNDELPKINKTYPMVNVWDICIMPDHIHMIINVSDDLPHNKQFGHVMGAFKGGCSRAWWNICGYTDRNDCKPLFADGYNDGILLDDGQIDRWKVYIHDNPRRLAVKRARPDLYRIWQSVEIGTWKCQMIGNIFMLNFPDIMAVVVHRSDSDEAFNLKFKAWMECGERGGVLVSAAIAQREKLVMREAMNRGYRLIVLRENGFNKYYKPGGASFDACAQGRMLQVCPWDYHTEKRVIQRSQCLELNALALCVSAMGDSDQRWRAEAARRSCAENRGAHMEG